MLRTRVLTALIAVPVVVIAIVFLPTLIVALLVAALMLWGAREWASLSGLDSRQGVAYVGVTAALMAFMLALRSAGVPDDEILILLAALFWLAAIYLIVRFPAVWSTTLGQRTWALTIGVVVLTAPVVAVAYVHEADQGPLLVLLLCLMIWGADTGAYAAGRTLGRHKLAPNVSPGKTREGALGGVAAATVIGALGALTLGYNGWRIIAMMILGSWIAIISVVGDLTISMFKRSAGVKDSGRLFPGHGGVLDRMDSMLAAAPWYVIGLHLVLQAA